MKLSKYMYGPLAVASVVATPLAAFAQGVETVGGVNAIQPATSSGSLSDTVSKVLNIIFWVATIMAIIYLVMSGINYITAGGDPEKADGARKGIVNAIIGLVIIALAYVIVGAVTGSIGTPGGGGFFDPAA